MKVFPRPPQSRIERRRVVERAWRQYVGVVDITGPWEVQRRHALLAAKAIARAIEERLRAVNGVREGLIRYAFRAAHGSGDALVAVDARGTVLAVNDAAARRRVFDAGALPPGVRASLLRTLASTHAADASIEDTRDATRFVVTPVHHDGTVIGAILRVASAVEARSGRGAARDRAVATPSAGPRARHDFARILGTSPALLAAIELARVAARNRLPVTLLGEPGTGKELFAHAIHVASARASGPFVAVNCGSIPAQLVESEPFGYEPGTFTGGRREGSSGRFEDAHGGTLFLDEVSDLSGQAQTALLRVLQEKEAVRLGGGAARPVDVRILAATHKPLLHEIEARRFRRDLYYRLQVLAIELPPLRDRGDDVGLLARHYLAEAESSVGRRGLTLTRGAMAALSGYAWPGNVRELRNVILRAAAVAPSLEIDVEHLQLERQGSQLARAPPERRDLRRSILESERQALVAALEACAWNVSATARRLGVSRMTLYRRLARHGLVRGAETRRAGPRDD